jgi:hypothetical protein
VALVFEGVELLEMRVPEWRYHALVGATKLDTRLDLLPSPILACLQLATHFSILMYL